MLDTLDIREGLITLIESTDVDHDVFGQAEVAASLRNSFCLRLDPEGPIFTVTITVGGSL
jgi:hypothetical protein